MPNTLNGVLARIPGLAGYEAARMNNQNTDMTNVGLLQRIHAAAQQQALERERFQQMSLDRAAGRDATAAQREATLTFQREAQQQRTDLARAEMERKAAEAKQRSEDQKLTEAERNKARLEQIRLVAQLRAPQQEQPPVAVIGPDGKAVYVSRKDAIGKTPATTTAEKLLPGPLQKQLTEAAELADATTRFKTTFKDTYGGKTLSGELSNTAGRIFGDDTGQTQWWQDYELHQSQIRNKLFGSALTTAEIEAWNKSAINPRMDPQQIRANLKRRDELEQRAIDRLIKGATAGKYNKEQIEAFTGRSAGGAATKYVEIRTTADGRTLGKKADGTIEEIKQ